MAHLAASDSQLRCVDDKWQSRCYPCAV